MSAQYNASLDLELRTLGFDQSGMTTMLVPGRCTGSMVTNMTSKRTAIVLGASGSVGGAVVRRLLADADFGTVVILSRRSLSEFADAARAAGKVLVEKLVPEMTPEKLSEATTEAALSAEGEVEGLSALGIGAGTAKLTLDQHRAVDVALNEAFARGLKESGKVAHLAFMSAAGANPQAAPGGSGAAGMPRYNRVKGEAEQAVLASGPPGVSIFRPAMIIGSVHTPWLLEKTLPLFSLFTPGKYKSISVDQIAGAMVATAKNHPPENAIYHYPEMIELIEGDQS